MSITAEPSREISLQGYCSPKHEGLREAFLRNFREFGEVGGSYAVMIEGELVADLWGGSKDFAGTRPWEEDSVACIWSASKGIGATCFAMIVDQGLVSYDDKVSKFWPEFAAHGKGELTVGQMLSHQAGITGFTTPATLQDLLAGEPAAERLAAQEPLWPPGAESGYSNVIGILSTALFQRIEGRSIKQFVADELKRRHGFDLSVGLPPQDRGRAADLLTNKLMDPKNTIPTTNPAQAALHNPPMYAEVANEPQWQDADIVAANGFANGRSLARMYGAMIFPTKDRRPLVGPATLAEATKLWSDRLDVVRGTRRPWGAGYLMNEEFVWGPNRQAFGHGGWGGAFGFADPVAKVSVGYAMNLMSDEMDDNPRRRGLIQAVYAAI
ncbi:MAG: hypothetical protein JWQ97_2403 [Phenylobacterium sp.]|nr:hypothetical protein [Phenylobacterium sp.]